MDKPDFIEGGCLCGATRYRATGQPSKSTYCHCNDCRKATGGPIAAWLMYDENRIEFIKGSPQTHEFTPGVLRGFCPVCGTPLWWQGMWHEKLFQMVTIGSLDHPEIYPPDRHASCYNQISWFEVADDLPRYQHSSPEGK